MAILAILRAAGRNHDEQGWLESWRAFPAQAVKAAGIDVTIPLLAIVDDRLTGGEGFGEHPHRDMEILSYPLEGVLEHKDSLGNGSRVGPGELQLMTAGTGVRHSEYNGSSSEPVRFLQIWIEPRDKGLDPGYQTIRFDGAAPLTLLGAPDGAGGAATLHQDVHLWRAAPARDEAVRILAGSGRLLWIHVVRGAFSLEGETIEVGDGAAIASGPSLAIQGLAGENEALIFVMRSEKPSPGNTLPVA